MTTATLVEHEKSLRGLKFGTATVANGYTTMFGFAHCAGAIVTTSSDVDAIVGATPSSGTITISAVAAAGTAVTVTFTVNYIAWGTPGQQ